MPKTNRVVIIWLVAVCFTIFSMVVVGGIDGKWIVVGRLATCDWHHAADE